MQEENILLKKKVENIFLQKKKLISWKCSLTPQFHYDAILFWKGWEIKGENWDKKRKVRKRSRYIKGKDELKKKERRGETMHEVVRFFF